MIFSYNSCFSNKYSITDLKRLARKFKIKGHTKMTSTELCPLLREKMNDVSENEKIEYIILEKDHPLKPLERSAGGKRTIPIVFSKINFIDLSAEDQRYYELHQPTIDAWIERTIVYITEHAINNNRAVNNNVKNKLNDPGRSWKPKVGTHKLANNATLNNNVFSAGNIPKLNKTVYLKPNLQNNKVTTVYNLNGIKSWLMKDKTSPMTRKSINSWNNVLKLDTKEYRKAKPRTNINNIMNNGSDSIEYLQKIKKTKLITRLEKLFNILVENVNVKRKANRVDYLHAINNKEAKQTILTCLTNVKILADYIKTISPLKNQKEALKRFDNSTPVCTEHMCSYIYEFVEIDKTGFSFSYDSKANNTTNFANLATAIRKMLCTQYAKKEITKRQFLKKMENMRSLMYIYLKPHMKTMSMDTILDKIDKFLKEYGDYLISCEGLSASMPNIKNKNLFPKTFEFKLNLNGIRWANY